MDYVWLIFCRGFTWIHPLQRWWTEWTFFMRAPREPGSLNKGPCVTQKDEKWMTLIYSVNDWWIFRWHPNITNIIFTKYQYFLHDIQLNLCDILWSMEPFRHVFFRRFKQGTWTKWDMTGSLGYITYAYAIYQPPENLENVWIHDKHHRTSILVS